MNEAISQHRLAWGLDEISTGTGLSIGFLRGQLRIGALKSRRIGRRLLILDEDLRAWLGQDSRAEGIRTEGGK